MKALGLIIAVALLCSCDSGKADLQQYVMEVKARKVPLESEVPEIKPFEHVSYNASEQRSPFVAPQPEIAVELEEIDKKCAIAPNLQRQRQLLEQFDLSNLSMRGIMAEGATMWALIEAPSGEMHRVRTGNYIGLHHGNINSVSKSGIDIKEVVADGDGCWIERTTQLELMQP